MLHAFRLTALIGAALLAGCASTEPPPQPAPPALEAIATPPPPVDPRIERADAVFANFAADKPGGGVMVTQHGKVLYERYVGIADMDNAVPINAKTRFHVASVTKQFVAYAAHLLAQEGKLDLDADIRTWLPEMPAYAKPVTTRQLLNHTSGVRDQWGLFILSGNEFSDVLRQRTALALLSRQRALNFEPGTAYEYSNGGFTVAAAVIEKVSGMSFRAFLDERVAKLLGMTNTFVLDDITEIIPGRAVSYTNQASPRIARLNYSTWGATSLHSTAHDLSAWMQELNKPVKLNAAAVAAMLQPALLNDGTKLPYASGIQVGDIAGHRTISHGGSDAGFRAFVIALPDDDATIVVTLNNSGNPSALTQQLGAAFFDIPATPPPATTPVAAPAADVAQRLAGRYAPDYGSAFEILSADGKLTLGGTTASFREDGGFYFGNPAAWMKPTPDGRGMLRDRGDGSVETLRRLEVVQPTAAELQALAGNYHSQDVDETYGLEVRDGQLRLTNLHRDPVPLITMDRDHFSAPALFGGVVKILRNKSGRVEALDISIMGGRLRHVRFDKVK